MITVISDTHGERDHRLTGRTRDVVRASSLVVHAGDFTTERVFEAIESMAGGSDDGELLAVYGNSDSAVLRKRLSDTRVFETMGLRFVLVHGHEHDQLALSFLARQETADVVVCGHTHRPLLEQTPHTIVLNPGSYADPRGPVSTHAELSRSGDDSVRVRVRDSDGAVHAELFLPGDSDGDNRND